MKFWIEEENKPTFCKTRWWIQFREMRRLNSQNHEKTLSKTSLGTPRRDGPTQNLLQLTSMRLGLLHLEVGRGGLEPHQEETPNLQRWRELSLWFGLMETRESDQDSPVHRRAAESKKHLERAI